MFPGRDPVEIRIVQHGPVLVERDDIPVRQFGIHVTDGRAVVAVDLELRFAGAERLLRGNVPCGCTPCGQPHDGEPLIVQEFVPHDCELRLYFVEGVCELVLATKMEPGDDDDKEATGRMF